MTATKLRMLVLKQLDKGPRAGYGLSKDIFEATGWKPSYGSLYPILEQMRQEELITFKEEGKKKIYSLTKKGSQNLKELSTKHNKLIDKLRENHKLLSHLCNLKEDPLAESMFHSLEQGKIPLSEFMKESAALKSELFRLYQSDKVSKHEKSIKLILSNATKQLRKLS